MQGHQNHFCWVTPGPAEHKKTSKYAGRINSGLAMFMPANSPNGGEGNMLQFQIFEQLAPRTGAAIMYGFRPPSCSYPCEVLVSVPSNAIWHGASMESISITAIARNGRSKNGDTHGPRNLFHFGRHFFLKPCFFPGGSRHPSCLWWGDFPSFCWWNLNFGWLQRIEPHFLVLAKITFF